MKNIGSALWGLFEKVLKTVLTGILKLFGKQISDEKWESLLQFIKFGLVGVLNTAISYAVYSALVYFGVHFLISSILSFVVSVLNSFYWNNKYVFSANDAEKRSWLKALIKTFAAYSFTGLFLNNVLLVLWIKLLHMSEYAGPLLNLFISIPVNYFLNKYWAFKKTPRTLANESVSTNQLPERKEQYYED